jgi:hypothetical protein
VNKAELVIESKPEDDFLKGVCSACPSVRFDLTGNTLKQKQLLRGLFDMHVRRFHQDDNTAPQAKP